ncbi:MAG: ankyrin repeat domain-containing protein [Bryobacterales bacterium]|nr:ankyrin repeat domain-containing protein [Bryobacterales bacterium]
MRYALIAFSFSVFAADVETHSPDGTTPLHWAVRNDDLATVDKLIKAGADVKTADRYGVTPLYLACTNASVPIIRKLLDAGADPNAPYASNGEIPLMTVIHAEDNVDALKALLDRGADVNIKDTVAGETALMWAVRENRPLSVRLLLDHGAQVDISTRIGKRPAARPPNAGGGSHGAGIVRSGWPERGFQDATPGGMTALLYASRDGRMETARMLLDSKAGVNLAEANKLTPLLIAILNNHIELANVLLERGADVNARDFWGRTPLWAAVELRNLDVNKTDNNGVDRAAALKLIDTLIGRGANVNARTQEVPPIRRWIMPLGDLSWVDFTGQTPFLRAALSGDVTVMRLLLQHGADPNIPTLSGTTALMAAAGVNWMGGQTYTESKESQLEAVKLCVEKGADVNAVNSMGIGAVIGAVNRGSDDILQYLVDRGARLDIKDNEGRTPMVWAEGVFLATNPPERKPSTVALLQKLGAGK